MLTTAEVRGAEMPLEEEVARFMSAEHPDRQALRRDPYPFYDRLREAAPVYKTARGPWLVTSHALVDELVRGARWTRETGVAEEALSLGERVFLRSLVFRDAPAHTRLRRILTPLFTPSAIEQRRRRTRAIAGDLLASLRPRASFDFRADFASELPVRLICEFIGMPADDREAFGSWAESVRMLQEHGHGEGDAEARRSTTISIPSRADTLARVDKIAEECLAYFHRLLEAKRRQPGDDLTSLLLAASLADDAPLNEEEIVSMLIILHVGGHSTTTDAIATGQFHLFRNPDAARALRYEPGLVAGAVEEMLRFDPPVTVGIPRIATQDMVLGDTTIPQGDHVYPVLAAANRDARRFADPHRFDIRRADNKHISFSAGPHFCIGAPLGRQEAQEAFALLATEYPPLEPAAELDTLDWQDSLPHRGLKALPVRWAT
jgi:cytochrome P450